MKEQMPSLGEMKKIQDENMTEDEKKMSEERAATFRAGFEEGRDVAKRFGGYDLVTKMESEKRKRQNKELVEDFGLSNEAAYHLDRSVSYNREAAVLSLNLGYGNAGKEIKSVTSELIDKLPRIEKFQIYDVANCGTENIEKVIEKFPSVSIILMGTRVENDPRAKKLQKIAPNNFNLG